MITIFYFPDSTTHCAIALTGLGEENFYLSFMPANVGGGFRLHNIAADVDTHKATRIVNIPSEESCGFGLSEAGILQWYREKLTSKRFSHLSYNCSSALYEALCEGQKAAKSLGNQVILKKDWKFDLPYKIMNYGQKLVHRITRNQTNCIKNLSSLDEDIVSKILELDNLYKARSKISEHDFIYSFSSKILYLANYQSTHPTIKQLQQSVYQLFLEILRDQKYPTEIRGLIESTLQLNDIDGLKSTLNNLISQTDQIKRAPTGIHTLRCLFGITKKDVNIKTYQADLKKLIDDAKNVHKKYFEKGNLTLAESAQLRYQRYY